MKKVANNHEFQRELHRILAYCQGTEKPEREKLATDLRELAFRVAAKPEMPKWLERALKRHKNVEYKRHEVRIKTGPNEAKNNKLEDQLASMAHRNRDEEWDIDVSGVMDPKSGDYSVVITL